MKHEQRAPDGSQCTICQHPRREHDRAWGCSHQVRLHGTCACTFVQQPPLSPHADAVAHRERSDWWDVQARKSAELAKAARYDLDRWHPLMALHRAARQAELDHRLRADRLERAATTPALPSPAALTAPRAIAIEPEVPATPANVLLQGAATA